MSTSGGEGARGFVTWQTIATAALGVLASGLILFGKNTVDHLGGLDQALTNQTAALNRMAGAMDSLTQSNSQFNATLGKIEDRIHLAEEAESATRAMVVTNEHDVGQLRDDFNRHLSADGDKFRSLGVERHQ